MARPKSVGKLLVSANSATPRGPFKFDTAQKKDLVSRLGLKLNNRKALECLAEAEDILSLGRDPGFTNRVTPQNVLVSIAPVRKAAHALRDSLNKLDHFTVSALVLSEGHEGKSADALEVLIQAIERLQTKYTREAQLGRPVNLALRDTVRLLARLYARYSAVLENHKDRDSFISDCLCYAGIPHPDPDTDKTRFRLLLQ